ncbi:MAG: HlyD family secretion protein [Clostridia bacterium]|nr:HlyD family secretion protein [Clostridia bacterium]
MLKRYLAAVLALALLGSAALAEVYEGSTVAAAAYTVPAGASGVLEALDAGLGQAVETGEILGSIASEKVFASQDGSVARIREEANSISLDLMPVERYQIYCTVDEGLQTAGTTLVHSGERVYLSCTTNGTHQAVGVITMIDSSEYRVLTIGGELYVGETVYVYRDENLSYKQWIGTGTVVSNDVESYESAGELVEMHVEEGEFVQRGELLYEYADSAGLELVAGEGGVICEVLKKPGDRVEKGQAILKIVPEGGVQVEVLVDEEAVSRFAEGSSVELGFAEDAEERSSAGTVVSISRISENGGYAVRIQPEQENLKLGMTTLVRTVG